MSANPNENFEPTDNNGNYETNEDSNPGMDVELTEQGDHGGHPSTPEESGTPKLAGNGTSSGSSSGSGGSKRPSRSSTSGTPAKQRVREAACHSTSPARDNLNAGGGARLYQSPNTVMLNESQAILRNVSMSGNSQDDYVNLSQVQEAIMATQRQTPVTSTQSGHTNSSGNVQMMEYRSPLNSNGTRAVARRPATLGAPERQYVPLEEFQRSMNPMISQDAGPHRPYGVPSGNRHVNNPPPVRNLAPVFNDPDPFDDDDEDEETITIQACLQLRHDERVNTTCICQVIELESEQPVHPLVIKPRRKICVADHTAVMVGYIKRPQPVHFERGNTLRLYGFTMKSGEFLIHSNTSASTTADIVLSDQVKVDGLEEYYRPRTPFMTVQALTGSPNGTTGSLKGTVTKTEQARTVGKGRQSLVKSLTVKDCSGEIKCSLWGSAANSGDIELGQQIVLSDIKTYYCNLTHDVIMNVNNADQIQLRPPQDLDEIIKVMGVEQTDRYSTLILACVKSRVNERYTIERQILCNLFNGGAPITIRQILDYLPFRAKVHISGQSIMSMQNVRVSRRVLARLRSGHHHLDNAASSRGECSNRGQNPQSSRPSRSSTRQTSAAGGSVSDVSPPKSSPFALRAVERPSSCSSAQEARPSQVRATPRQSASKSTGAPAVASSTYGGAMSARALAIRDSHGSNRHTSSHQNSGVSASGRPMSTMDSQALGRYTPTSCRASAVAEPSDVNSQMSLFDDADTVPPSQNYGLKRLFENPEPEMDLTAQEEETLLFEEEEKQKSDADD